MRVEALDNCVKVSGLEDFSLVETCECGQCFRWNGQPDGTYIGIAAGKRAQVEQKGDALFFYGVTEEEFEEFWRGYFDLDFDYGAVRRLVCGNEVLRAAAEFAPGIRILRAEPWETLCSFIISQNNNIPRIKGIIERLCSTFGEEIEGGGYSFPGADRLAGLKEEDLAPLRCGFRAGYILDAARKVAEGEIDLEALRLAPIEEARAELQKIRGVGPKVAECVLLYGLHRLEAFPVDVWMKKAMTRLFPEGLPECARPFAGIAQQYLYHYVRNNPEVLEERAGGVIFLAKSANLV